MALTAEPCAANGWLAEHAGLLLHTYRHWTGRDLVDPAGDSTSNSSEAAKALYHAPFVVLSHDTAADPCFTYANLTAQTLFEMPWAEIVGLPSRFSAEAPVREERERLLRRVAEFGFIDDYRGVRVAKSGRRFQIERATVWNLVDEHGARVGQAATFAAWRPLVL